MSDKVTGTFSGNGNSAEIVTTGQGLFVSARGTWGSGTVTLQLKLTDGTWVAIDTGIMAAITADGDKFVSRFAPGLTLRLALTGATGPDIDYIIQG